MITRLRQAWANVAIILIMLLAVVTRLLLYGDLRLSVGNADTPGYIESSLAPAFSWDSFAGKRLFTTNLLYKLANDPASCPLTAISNPAEGREVEPALQPCFDRIAVLQHLLSIFAWCYLAWTISRWLRHPAARIGVALTVLLFGFTPQVAEWDSILSPESLSTSLFVLLVALVIELAFQIAVRRLPLGSPVSLALLVAIGVVFPLWALTRDVHLYAIPVTVVALAMLLRAADRHQRKLLLAAIAILMGLFALGDTSARDSRRATRIAIGNVYSEYLLPHPARLAFFQQIGMPDPASPEFPAWLDDNGTRAYAAFLLSHPGYVLTHILKNPQFFRGEFTQQYFRGVGNTNRGVLLAIGEMVHPQTNAVYLLDLLLFSCLFALALQRSDAGVAVWTWLAAWLLLAAFFMLMASFFGDTEAFRRHMYVSVEAFRLTLWILLFVVLDRVLARTTAAPDQMEPINVNGDRPARIT